MAAIPLNQRRIFITGGAGFIGSHVVRFLVRSGAQIALLVQPGHPMTRIQDLTKNISLFEGSLPERDVLRRICAEFNPDTVLHLAAELKKSEPESLFTTNVVGTKNLLDVLLELKKPIQLVALGTIEECAGGEPPWSEQSRELPTSFYALTKLLETKLIEYAGRAGVLHTLVIRPSVV